MALITSSKHGLRQVEWILILALATPTAMAALMSPECSRDCEGLIGVNLPAEPLTQARISVVETVDRDAFVRYLKASNTAREADRAVLRIEREGLEAIPAPRAPGHGGANDLPLNAADVYYASDAALEMARELMSFQVPSGGWGKNMRRTGVARARGQSYVADDIHPDGPNTDHWRYVGTFDNDATTTELRFLAKVQSAQTTDRAAIRESIVRGVALLIAAQYPNGGWPQNYPLSGSYSDAITLNDDAMLNVVQLLYDIGHRKDETFAFIDDDLRTRAVTAADAGIAWFVEHQVRIDGRRTLWGQQHDVLTQCPTAARAFEMPALASFESVRVIAFLMTLPNPEAAQRAAVHDAVAFLRASRIAGKRWEAGELVDDPQGAVWSRFYALDRYAPSAETVDARVRPLFGDRPQPHDSQAYGLVFDSVDAVSAERRRGYAQYNTAGEAVLRAYETWAVDHPR